MKKTLSFLMASVMAFSLLPAVSVSAASTNQILNAAGTVASDYNWVDAAGRNFTPAGTPYDDGIFPGGSFESGTETGVVPPILSVKSDTGNELIGGTDPTTGGFREFSLTLRNAEFVSRADWGKINAGGFNGITARDTEGNSRVLDFDPARDGVFVYPGYRSDVAFKLIVQSNTTATVQVIGTTLIGSESVDFPLLVPLPVRMRGEGTAEVVLTRNTSMVTNQSRPFATGAAGGAVYEISDSTVAFQRRLNVPEISITETTPGTIDWGRQGSIELRAPNGFEWDADTSTVAGDPNRAQVRFSVGFSGASAFDLVAPVPGVVNNHFLSSRTIVSIPFYNTVANGTITAEGIMERSGTTKPHNSTVANGVITIRGLILVRTESVANTPTGDVRVRVSVTGAGSENIIVGRFAQRAVSITAEPGTVPDILGGAWPNQPLADKIKTLKVRIRENSPNAWNENMDAVFTLNNGDVRIRAAEITRVAGMSGQSRGIMETARSERLGAFKIDKSNKIIVEASRWGRLNRGVNSDLVEIDMILYVSVRPGFRGDITFSTHEDNDAFTGTESAVIARAIDPFTVTTQRTDLRIGEMRVPVGDITIKENQAGAIVRTTGDSNADVAWTTRIESTSGQLEDRLLLWIGGGQNWIAFNDDTRAVTHTVVSGDLVIDKVVIERTDRTIGGNAGGLAVEVKRESTVPSEFKLSNLQVDVGRMVPEGRHELRIGGSATANFNDGTSANNDAGGFGISYFAADPEYVNVITSAPGRPTEFTTEIAVTIDNATAKVDGRDMTMDVPPFIENGYTMVPVRFVATALGLQDNQIQWNAAARTVTIVDSARGRTAQFRVGGNTVNVNGVEIPFEGPSVTIRNSRSFLPLRALGELVLGTNVSWDDATRTAWINRR